jgi:hypothetical protein
MILTKCNKHNNNKITGLNNVNKKLRLSYEISH